MKCLNSKNVRLPKDLQMKCDFTFTSAVPAMISPASEMGRNSGISW